MLLYRFVIFYLSMIRSIYTVYLLKCNYGAKPVKIEHHLVCHCEKEFKMQVWVTQDSFDELNSNT